jgi:predicted porin
MQKKLIAAAVAGALFAPAALADVTIGGKIEYSLDRISSTGQPDGSDAVTGADHSSRIVFSASEKLGGGTSAGFLADLGLNTAAGAGPLNRNQYVFLGGNFGEVRMGRHDTPYKIATGSLDVFAETRGDYTNILSNNAGTNDYDLRVAQTVAYITPNMSGFHGAIAYVSTLNGFNGGANTGSDANAWSAMVMYEGSKAASKNGFFASLAYEQHKNVAGLGITSSVTGANDRAWKLGLGYNFGPGKIGFVYQDVNAKNSAASGNSATDRTTWLLNGAYTFGNNTLKAEYGRARDSANNGSLGLGTTDGSRMWAIGLDHAMSKRTTVYGMYASMRNDAEATRRYNDAINETGVTTISAGADPKVWSFGIKHTF